MRYSRECGCDRCRSGSYRHRRCELARIPHSARIRPSTAHDAEGIEAHGCETAIFLRRGFCGGEGLDHDVRVDTAVLNAEAVIAVGPVSGPNSCRSERARGCSWRPGCTYGGWTGFLPPRRVPAPWGRLPVIAGSTGSNCGGRG
ncbi:hypothetical protein NSPZN2_11340 [Nitrospira defluvii]|uniref:Uncharacterized protein n=1 Tax=Nitrospira defluvii TaxID=330214 RepID=A0ABN7KUT0_9BACT|nr:hypothetical protein NSPZN2_11340 [Nitrospira defluvii]